MRLLQSGLKLVPILLIALGLFNVVGVEAQQCSSPNDVSCGNRAVVIDFACQRQKIVDPGVDCCLYKCEGDADAAVDETLKFNVFGININARSDALLQTFFFVGVNIFLGIVGIASGFVGLYAAYLRANPQKDGDVEKSAKYMQNALAGLTIIATSFVIAQLVASALGLGSINELVSFDALDLRN